MVEALGFVAALLTTVSGLPQFIKIIKDKSAKEVSSMMYLLLGTGNLCWLAYGLLIQSKPLIVANFITFAISSSILISKKKYS